MGFTYVIEHMEEDEETTKAIPPWVELEYAHMRTLAGPDAHVQFTSLSQSSCDYLESVFASSHSPLPPSSSSQDRKAQVSFHRERVMQRMLSSSIPLDKVCLLDPKAEKELATEDGDGRFEWFLFGGILGDDPPRDRTSELRVRGFPTRHLGPVQMTTDTALGVTRLVVQDRIPLKEIPYIDQPTIRFNAKESVEMPFRYISDDTKEPRLPPGMKELLQEDLNKTFDF
ncbi:SAM-dependent RNA methyltransferase [Gymnopilus junonius]|uniref:SAM-dependent RNA methyltransferase n=1 Tax=Gymnopilus junonius TaxID=109634 RepID=A0A9P5NZ17_GYMJU|nr:SAM-dependent RNA methyltransferase [Gymnopilus junonius]